MQIKECLWKNGEQNKILRIFKGFKVFIWGGQNEMLERIEIRIKRIEFIENNVSCKKVHVCVCVYVFFYLYIFIYLFLFF